MKKMEDLNFFVPNNTYRELFLKFPLVFLTGETYKDLSNDAKIAYMVFKDRLYYSMKNNWVDENNRIYFIYTNEELSSLLGLSEKTTIKVKNELIEYGLLFQRRMGFNAKKKRNEPNRLYLLDLEVTATDVYVIDQKSKALDTSGTVKTTVRQEIAEALDTSGTVKTTARQEKIKIAEALDTSGTVKTTARQEFAEALDTSGTVNSPVELDLELSTKDSKDIKDISKTEKNVSKLIDNSFNSKETNQELENILIDDYIEEKAYENLYGEQLIRRIKLVSYNDFDTFTDYMNKLEFAQKSVEQEEDVALPIYQGAKYFDDLEQQLLRTLTRTIQQHRFGKIKSIENYLFISFKNTYQDFANAIKEETSSQTP